MKKNSRDLTTGNIKRQLIKLTWPMLFGMMGIVIFNLVDTYFVGQLGVDQLAAMSFSFPIIMFINSISLGIGIGTSSLISRHVAKSTKNDLRQMAARALSLGFIVVVVFVTIGLLTIDPIFKALGAKPELLGYIHDYMSIWYFGVAFVVFPMIGNNIVRATGDTFTPGMVMMSSGIFNMILDPLLIFGYGPFPELGIKGAALATVIARSSSFIFILIILIRRDKLLTLYLGSIKDILGTWKKILYIAGPATLSNLITPISIGLITKIIADYGKEAVAGFGVASRIEMFALMVIAALGSVLMIFVGQNISKLQFKRIYTAIQNSAKFSFLWGILFFIVIVFFSKQLAGLFSNDSVAIEITSKYLKFVGSSYMFLGWIMLSTSTFNGINRPYPATILSIIRMLGLYVPLAWIGSKVFGINGIFIAALTANVLVGVASLTFLHKSVKKLEQLAQ